MYQTEHYKEAGIPLTFQPIDLCRELPFSLGNAVKYILRAGRKNNMREDLDKAIDYLQDFMRFGLNQTGKPMSARGLMALMLFCSTDKDISNLFNYKPARDGDVASYIPSESNGDDKEDAEYIQVTEESIKNTILSLRERKKHVASCEHKENEKSEKVFKKIHIGGENGFTEKVEAHEWNAGVEKDFRRFAEKQLRRFMSRKDAHRVAWSTPIEEL